MASLLKMLNKCIAVTAMDRYSEWIHIDLVSARDLHFYTGLALWKILDNRIWVYSELYGELIQDKSKHNMPEGKYCRKQAAQYLLKMIYKKHHHHGDRFKEHNFRDDYEEEICEVSVHDGYILQKNGSHFYSDKKIAIKKRHIKYAEKLNKMIEDRFKNLTMEQRYELLVSDSRTFKGEMRLIALKKGGYRCAICGRTNKEAPLEVDHIVPWSKGGRTAIANSRVLCKECNIAVSNKQKF